MPAQGDDTTGKDGQGRGPAGAGLDPRERILRATAELIAELGWTRVTTRKVAERAGVNNALVHYYFGTKRALLVQAATDALMNEIGGPMDALMSHADLGSGVAEAIAWLEGTGPSHTSSRIVVEMMAQAVHDPALRETSRAMLQEFRQVFRARAIERGLPPAEAGGLATVVAALLDGLYLHVLLDPDLDLSAAAAALRPLFPEENR